MRKKWFEETIKQYVENEGYIFIKLLTDKGLDSRIIIQCNNGHKPYEVTFRNFKGNNSRKPRRCPYCSNKEFAYFEDIKEFAHDKGYDILIEDNEYKNVNQILKFKHRICGETTDISFLSFKSRLERGNEPCDVCANRIDVDYEYVSKKMEEINYKLLSLEYHNAHELLEVQCDCSHTFPISWNKFQQGRRCPYCNTTYGEREIINYLNKNNISYIYNKGYFKDLLSEDGRVLKPDFIIEDKKIWIEYDGIQHFEPVDFAGKGEEWASEQFEKNKKHDNIKDEYAKENKWKLIRIPYWKFNDIENILKEELK